MAVNEVQEFVVGSFDSPLSADGGSVDMTFDGQTVNVVLAVLNAAGVQSFLESLSNIEPGDVSVTGGNPFLIEFTGIYAGMDVPQISLANSSGYQTANTVSLNVVQSGSSPSYASPVTGGDFTDGTNDDPGTNEVQQLSLNGATTGTFDVTWNGNTTTWTIGVSTISSVCDAIIGSGYYSITDFGTSWYIEFQGAYAATNVDDITISNNTTDGSPSAYSVVDGSSAVTGTPAVQTITFSPAAETGTWSLDGITRNWNESISGSISGYDANGGSASMGSVTLTYASNGAGRSPLSYGDIDLLYATSPGQQHIFTVTLSDSPDQGEFRLIENGMQVGSDMAWNSSDSDVQGQIGGYGGGYTVTGSAGGPWTCTSVANVSHTWTGGESGSNFLRRTVPTDIRTNVEGEPDPDPPASRCPGIIRTIDKVIRRDAPGGVLVINRRINIKCYRIHR